MEEFTAELRARVLEARDELQRARDNGDEYDIQVVSGRLDNLMRLASAHGIAPVREGADAGDEG